MALLGSLLAIKQSQGGRGAISAVHINHQLRGAESDADQAFCQQLCSRWKVDFEALQGDVLHRAEQEGDGVEAAARNERYALLTAAAEKRGARFLVTAHTRDDQVETILFRLLRGTGLKGLAGISAQRALTPSLSLVRPLLGCARQQLLDFLAVIGQDYRTDSSNFDSAHARNRLRGDLLPHLRADYNPSVDEALLRLAEQARETVGFCETQARQLVAEKIDVQPGAGFALPLELVIGRPELLIREAMRLVWREAGLGEQGMTHHWWCQLAELASTVATDRTLNLPGNILATVRENQMYVRRLGC